MTVATNQASPTITVADHPDGEFYELTSDGEQVGLLVYHVIGKRLSITHSTIKENYRGRGLSSALIRAALDDIRAKEVTVANYCPVVFRFLDRNPEYADLIHNRPRLG